MKTSLVRLAVYCLLLSPILSSSTCSSSDPSPSMGTFTYFMRSDLGVGNVDIYLDNEKVGTISHIYVPDCGNGDVNAKRKSGTYDLLAVGGTGKRWVGTSVFENGRCLSQEITNGSSGSGGGGGGGGSSSSCKGTWVSNPTYVSLTSVKDNRCGTGGLSLNFKNTSNTTLSMCYSVDSDKGLRSVFKPGETLTSYSCTPNPSIKVFVMPESTLSGCSCPF